jgi:hypothetical protein
MMTAPINAASMDAAPQPQSSMSSSDQQHYETMIAQLQDENAQLRTALGMEGSEYGADGRTVLQELAALRQQVANMTRMLPILSIRNFTFSLVPSTQGAGGGKSVATYEILVNYGDTEYAVYRRYSEFRKLHQDVTLAFKEEHLPVFPGRAGFFRSTNHDRSAIEKRQKELQTYIRQLVASDDVRNHSIVTNFFANLTLDPTGGDRYEASIPRTASDDDC